MGIAFAALLAFGAGIATTEPAAIEAKRAEVARIQGELDGINTQVEVAAEAYNGARYQLGQVTARIDENTRLTTQTVKDLKASRAILAQRLRDLYATPEPSLAEVLITQRQHQRRGRRDEPPRPRRAAGRRASSAVSASTKALLAKLRKQLDAGPGHREPRRRAAPGPEGQGRGPPRPAQGRPRQRERRASSRCSAEEKAREARRGGRSGRPRPAARGRAVAAASSAGNTPSVALAPGAVSSSGPLPSGAGQRRRREHRHAVPGRALRLGRRVAERLRLQRPRLLRLRPDRQERPALHRRRVQRLPQGALRPAAARRPGLLRRPGPHGHLHRRRPVRAGPAHR